MGITFHFIIPVVDTQLVFTAHMVHIVVQSFKYPNFQELVPKQLLKQIHFYLITQFMVFTQVWVQIKQIFLDISLNIFNSLRTNYTR